MHGANSQIRRRVLLVGLIALLLPLRAGADAVIRSQAMSASTIVEYFIEAGRIRVELEVGLGDLPAFANLVPDDIYEKLGNPPRPLAERLPEFFRKDLVIVDERGQPLPGRVLDMQPRPRVRRDEITGEPLPTGENEEEIVVFARLEYPLAERPGTLSFLGPGGAPGASVGFVVYHDGIAVNDFRYLAARQTLDLDWDDPWYSRFRSRNLRRSYFAPMSGFLYVEPYEVRKEIIVRPLDLEHWIELGLGDDVIPVERQADLLREVAGFLRGHFPVRIDGEPIEPELARINFLERTLKTSRIIDPPIPLDVHGAIIGAIFVYPTEGLPKRVTMDWDLWSERIQLIPAAAVDQAGPLPTLLQPDFRVLEWQNFLKKPVLPTLRVLAPPPGAWRRGLLTLRWPALAAAIAALAWMLRDPRRRGAATALACAVAAACFWLSRDARLTDARAREVVSGLLHNVYRAFDFRDEERIYDTLALSVGGDLLTQTYLEARRGLELASQGGARVKVKDVDLLELESEPADAGGFVASATWNVAGSVGHWGHVHQRRNHYRAELSVSPKDGSWKLVGLEILEEERL